MLSVDLPIVLTNKNDGQSKHWTGSARERKTIQEVLFDLRREPFNERVDIVVTRILGKGQSLWDADSIGRGNAKQLIDSLVALGWFVDDGPQYIRNCDYRQDENQRKQWPRGATRVEVYSSDGDDPCEKS